MASYILVDKETKASFKMVNGQKGNFEQDLYRLVFRYIYIFLSGIALL